MAAIKLFDFLNDLNHGKKNLIKDNPEGEKDYSPWIINVGMSLGPDTILYANDMNEFYNLPKRMQHDYYFYALRARKRFNKWPKKLKPNPDIDILKKHFSVNRDRAEEYLALISPAELKRIKSLSTGGTTK